MFERLFSRFGYEKRNLPVDYDPRFSPDVWGRAVSPAGYVSAAGVISNSSVAHRAVDLKATLLASVSLKAYHTLNDGGRERAVNIPLARVLRRPNSYMSAFEFIELLSRSLDMTGNFFARVEHTVTGEIASLHPIASHRVQVQQTPRGTIKYVVSAATNDPARVLLGDSGEMLHVKNSSAEGLVGQTPLTTARNSLSLGITLDAAAHHLASNGMQQAGFVIQPTILDSRGKKTVRDEIESQGVGPKTAGKISVLDPGVKFIATSFSAADSELLESRKLSAEDTARVFGVPPQSVGIIGTTSYGSQQQAQQDLVTNCLAPLAARIESAIETCLLSPDMQRVLTVEFDLSSLLRADPSERWRTYEVGRRINALSPNEIRRFENLPAYVGGDTFEASHSQAPAPANDPIASTK